MNSRVLLMALVAMCAPVLAQDQKAPTFQAAINYVEFSLRVIDARGQFVRNLQQSDFRVLEDARPQTIARFQLVDLPIPNFNLQMVVARRIPLVDEEAQVVLAYAVFIRRPGSPTPRNVFSEWFVIDEAKIRTIYTAMFYPAAGNG